MIFKGEIQMTFIRTSTTFFALIFSVQIAIASGPTLLEDEATSRALVSASQIKTEESSTASSWWGLGSWVASAKNVVKTLFSGAPKKELSWEERWDRIVEDAWQQTLDYHQNNFGQVESVAKVLFTNPQEREKLQRILKLAENEGIDITEKEQLASLTQAENLAFLEDIQSLEIGLIATLICNNIRTKEDFPQFGNLLNQLYKTVEDKADLKEEAFFRAGKQMFNYLQKIRELRRSEGQLPYLKQVGLDFYTQLDGGTLSSFSKYKLDKLGIMYFADANRSSRRGRGSSSFSYGKAVGAGVLSLMIISGGVLPGVGAVLPQPTVLTNACRGTAIECLSVFRPAVGFGTQVAYFVQTLGADYNSTIFDMQKSSLSTAYSDAGGDVGGLEGVYGIYAEVSSWNNPTIPSTNVTRVLMTSGANTKGVIYQPGSATQHTETSFDNTPLNPFNIVTTPGVSGSINPYYYELAVAGDRWFLMTQYTDNQTIVVSEVFRPAAGAPFLKSYANMVITPQSASWKINLAALQSAYVAPGTPSRVTSQQGFTADQLQASYYTGSVASNDCASSITIQQFLAQNNIDLSALINCLQNSGYNPLSCRTISNPFGGYIQLLNYYMMNGVELHEVVVSGSTYTHDIYTSTGASSMSRMRHTFDWKAQGVPTTTTTAVPQSLSSRQGTLPNNGAIRKFAVFYYGGSDSAEPANVIKVDETGAVGYGTYFGTNRCGTKKRDVAEEQLQTKIEVVERRARLNLDEFKARQAESQTFVDSLKGWFGFGSPIAQPHHSWGPEKWYQFWQSASLAGGKQLQGVTLYQGDEGLEHNFLFSVNNGQFEVFCRSANSSNAVANNGKVKVM